MHDAGFFFQAFVYLTAAVVSVPNFSEAEIVRRGARYHSKKCLLLWACWFKKTRFPVEMILRSLDRSFVIRLK